MRRLAIIVSIILLVFVDYTFTCRFSAIKMRHSHRITSPSTSSLRFNVNSRDSPQTVGFGYSCNNYDHSRFHNMGPLFASEVTVLNLDNSQSTSIAPGQPLSLAAVRTGMRLSFQCKQGVCSSCETMLNGEKVRTCITKVPDMNKVTIKKAPKTRKVWLFDRESLVQSNALVVIVNILT